MEHILAFFGTFYINSYTNVSANVLQEKNRVFNF